MSVHLLFDRAILRFAARRAAREPGALGLRPRPADAAARRARGQYLTVVSSGVPELVETRGRELVELIADELTERLGPAELLWSRVSREPAATFAGRPGTAALAARAPRPARPNVVRAGAWTATGWPATMEGAIRSGRRAAQLLDGRAGA